jgi:hypothetical protein
MHDGASFGGQDPVNQAGNASPRKRDGSRWSYAPLVVVGIAAMVMVAVLIALNR